MYKSDIKQLLLEQKEEIKKLALKTTIQRSIEQMAKKSLKDNLIKVILGVRRCGKSILAHRILQNKNYGYINFDDERLLGLKTKNLIKQPILMLLPF